MPFPKNEMEKFMNLKFAFTYRSCIVLAILLGLYSSPPPAFSLEKIDRQAVVSRHFIQSLEPNLEIPLGNGEFCFNVDFTGLQTTRGNTMAHWGWHSFPLENCKKDRLIMPSEGDDTDVRDLFRKYGIVPNVRLTTLENYTAINMVEGGLGIGIMNEGITRYWNTNTVILPVDPPSTIELGITLPSLDDAAPAVREFVLFAAEKLGAEIPEQN